MVQVDFSENYTCKHQDEIQTAYWSQEQVTIFPVAIWTISDDQSHLRSFAEVASKLCKAVKVSFISSAELNSSADLLHLSACFKQAAAIPGISKYHCIEPLENGLVRFRIHSSQTDYVELADSPSDDDYSTSSNFESADDWMRAVTVI